MKYKNVMLWFDISKFSESRMDFENCEAYRSSDGVYVITTENGHVWNIECDVILAFRFKK